MDFYKKITLKGIASVLVGLSIFLLPLSIVVAAGGEQTGFPAGGQTGFPAGGQTGFPAGGQTGTFSNDANTLQNPLAVKSFCDLIAIILNAALIIGIPIAVLFIVFAGAKFVFARGNPGELEAARTNLFNTLIGIAIFVGASLIAKVIIGTLHELGVNVGNCLGS